MNHPPPIILVSVGTSYGGAERNIEILLRHLPLAQTVGILAHEALHIAQIKALARPCTELECVSPEDPPALRHAVRRFLYMYRRLRPKAVLANTEVSAQIVANAAQFLPEIAARSFIYVHDFLWTGLAQILSALPNATVLVPHKVVLEREGYLAPFVVPAGKVRALVLPNIVELPETPIPEPGPDASVLHLATVNHWKGHKHLLRSVELLHEAKAGLTVQSWGRQPYMELTAALRREVAARGLAEVFNLNGYIRDPAPLLRDCLCLVVTSVSQHGGPETFSRAMAEAWAHGRPVVAFAAGAPASLVRHEVDGLLVAEGDEAGLAVALRRLAGDAELCHRLGKNGLARVRAEFSPDVVVPRLLNILGYFSLLPGDMAVPSVGRSRVLLDLSRTLLHGWRSPVGLIRVETDVANTLCADSHFDIVPVCYDANILTYRELNRSELEFLALRGGALADTAARYAAAMESPIPVAWTSRQEVSALVGIVASHVSVRLRGRNWKVKLRPLPGRLAGKLPPLVRTVLCSAWRLLHRALSPRSAVQDSIPRLLSNCLVSAANPWDIVPPDVIQTLRRRGVELVLVLHDFLVWETPHLTDGREAAAYVQDMFAVVAEARRIVSVSRHTEANYRAVMESMNKTPAPVMVARPPNIRALHQLGTMPRRGLYAGQSFVLYCSTIEIRKNHIMLLHLWERLRQTIPAEQLPILVFVGKWGWGVDAVRLAVTRNKRLASFVRVLDDVDDQELVSLYRYARFSVFPSLAEGYGMPVAESLALGTPVLISSCPAVIEAAEGLMPALDALDFAAWEREVTRLITDDAYLATLRENAAAYLGPVPHALAYAVARAVNEVVAEPVQK